MLLLSYIEEYRINFPWWINSDNYYITLHINEKYEEQLKNLKNKSIKNKYDYALQKLFKNAKIIFFKSKYIKNMFWNC